MQHLAIAQDYSLLLIDTDRFKHINDLYGHSKGDEVLCALARTLESCARKGDLVFRWGGEEFVLLLPRTPLDTALSLAETIRVSVAKVSISAYHALPSALVWRITKEMKASMNCLNALMMLCIGRK